MVIIVNDYELLLFSWAQMYALELVLPSLEYKEQKEKLAEKLQNDHGITEIELAMRTLEEYAISYTQQNENHLVSFDADEIESIYDVT